MLADHCRTFGHRQPAEQALLPVWVLVVSYKGEKYLAGVNGQTGKVAVNLPIDERKQNAEKARRMVVGGLRGLGAALVVFAFFVGMFMLAVGTMDPMEALQAVANVKKSEDDFPIVQIFIAVYFVIAFAGITICEIRDEGESSKRRTARSMQNVRVASDADGFDSDGMTLTISEMGVGPAVR